MSRRELSHSELRTLTSCEAMWDFRYGGRLAGDALAPRTVAARLSEGKVWGRAIAVWHETSDWGKASGALDDAIEAEESYPGEHEQMFYRLTEILAHYTRTSDALTVTDPELAFDVALPAYWGGGRSNKYRLTGYLDGIHTDADGRTWIVEHKLRKTLSTYQQLALDRQGRRYAWAYERMTGMPVAGVIYNERLNEAPRPPKVLKSGAVSNDVRQFTTPELYAQACIAAGQQPSAETSDALAQRAWQRREWITFRPGELAETGQELAALAQRVHDIESGRLPIREPAPAHCPGCAFREICPNPSDAALVDVLFARQPAKRNREESRA